MKKLLFLFVAVATLTVGCSKDSNKDTPEEGGGKCRVIGFDGPDKYEFQYNNDGKVSHLKETAIEDKAYIYNTSFTYAKDKVTVLVKDDKGIVSTIVYMLSNGKVSSILSSEETLKLEYNSQGYLVKIIGENDIATLEYKGGNLVRWDMPKYSLHESITYDLTKDRTPFVEIITSGFPDYLAEIHAGVLYEMGYLGTKTKNRAIESFNKYKYEEDSKGNVLKIDNFLVKTSGCN